METIFRSWRALHFACHLDRAKRELTTGIHRLTPPQKCWINPEGGIRSFPVKDLEASNCEINSNRSPVISGKASCRSPNPSTLSIDRYFKTFPLRMEPWIGDLGKSGERTRTDERPCEAHKCTWRRVTFETLAQSKIHGTREGDKWSQ